MFCEKCGTKLNDNTCPSCGFIKFHNPIPVAVALVPVIKDGAVFLLGVVRGIEPKKGHIALPGGFQEIENILTTLVREVQEECNITVEVDPKVRPLVLSTEPVPNRLLVFIQTKALNYSDIDWSFKNEETEKLCLISLDTPLAFPLHEKAARECLKALKKKMKPKSVLF